MAELGIIILTKDEELHLARCLASIDGLGAVVFVVDSGSSDRTRDIAAAFPAHVAVRAWVNHAEQVNWAIEHFPEPVHWLMRLDADEVVDGRLRAGLARLAQVPASCTGLSVARKIIFKDRWIRHGGVYPTYLTRIWRQGSGRCEMLWMDEHMVITGGAIERVPGHIEDRNMRGIGWWTEKHNGYAAREAVDVLLWSYADSGHASGVTDRQTRSRRRGKFAYYSAPLFLRALLYFLYRYLLLLGILDGKEGLIWHSLQCLWYRFLVDAKIWEVRRHCRVHGIGIRDGIHQCLGIDPSLLSRRHA